MIKGSLGHRHGAAGRGHAGAVRSSACLRVMNALCAGEFSDQIGPLNVFSLHHLPHRRRHHDGPAVRIPVRAGDHRPAARQAGQGSADPRGRAGRRTLAKKGTPTMGGLMILSGVTVSTLLWANLGQLVRLDRAVRDAELRRHRLLRRLSQGHAQSDHRLLDQLAACWPRSW